MHMVDLIQKKRRGGSLTQEEIHWMIRGYTRGEIPDYQVSALLMAICFQGMDPQETAQLTLAMAQSGASLDLSALPGAKGDKHSTGGVGDKTTLVVAPLAAACGLTMVKLSGRGLGHTGGTVDKLAAIPGFRTDLTVQELLKVASDTGLCLAGHTGNLAPADQKLYALRDVTGTVDSIPLIASSIMSKKLACGAQSILLDVKVGSGALMKTRQEALELAQTMVDIGRRCHRQVACLLTDMDIPLGFAVGNALEVQEAIDTLKGQGPRDVTELSLALTAHLLALAGFGTPKACLEQARQALLDGRGLAKLGQVIQAQGGDPAILTNPRRLPQAEHVLTVLSPITGYLTAMDTEGCGRTCMHLGAGRERKEDPIDLTAGLVFHVKPGDFVQRGEPVAQLFAQDPARLIPAREELLQALSWGDTPPRPQTLIHALVTQDGVQLQ